MPYFWEDNFFGLSVNLDKPKRLLDEKCNFPAFFFIGLDMREVWPMVMREWEKYWNCNLATFRRLVIRGLGRHDSLAHEIFCPPQMEEGVLFNAPLASWYSSLSPISASLSNFFCPRKLLIERAQDVWTHSAKHGRVHQVSLETSFLVINLSRKSYGPGKWKQIQEKMEIKEVVLVFCYNFLKVL